jgi:hypothetical protein
MTIGMSESDRQSLAAQEKYHTILKTATDGFWTKQKWQAAGGQ